VVDAPRRPVISVKEERSAKTTVISTRRPSSRWAPHCVKKKGLRGLRRMPRHLKKTAANPTSGMPQTAQFAARGGVWVSKGALIATQHLERRDRVDDFICGHNGTGVIRDIDVESGVHLFIRVIRRCVFYHRDFVTEFSGKANGRFDAGMGYESDDDELVNAVLLEL